VVVVSVDVVVLDVVVAVAVLVVSDTVVNEVSVVVIVVVEETVLVESVVVKVMVESLKNKNPNDRQQDSGRTCVRSPYHTRRTHSNVYHLIRKSVNHANPNCDCQAARTTIETVLKASTTSVANYEACDSNEAVFRY
jgi:hypothetical protein